MNIDSWATINNGLEKTFVFGTFEVAIEFMNRCTPLITELNHHPEWKNVYNRVEVRLTTHDAGNVVTAKDWDLATLLDGVFAKGV